MKSCCMVVIAMALCLRGAAYSQAQNDPFGGAEDGQPVVQVYEVNDLISGTMPDNSAGDSIDLDDSGSPFSDGSELGNPTLPMISQGMGQGGGRMVQEAPHHNRANDLENLITKIVSPQQWDPRAGGESRLYFFKGLMIVSAPNNQQAQIRSLLDQVRGQMASRKTLIVETHWLWLTEEQLRELMPESTGAVDEKAWSKHQELLAREDSELLPGYHAVITCLNGQTVSTVAGRQRRFIISLIPVVGDDGSSTAPNASFTIGGANGRAVGYQPQSTTIQEGAALQVRPILCEEDQVLLDIHGRVVEVETLDQSVNSPSGQVAKKTGSDATSDIRDLASAVDRPVVNTSRIDTALHLPLNSLKLIGGITGSTRPEPDEPNLYLFAKVSVQKTAKSEVKAK